MKAHASAGRRKIVYVSHMRLTPRVARDWFIDLLRERGEDVEYWDVVAAVREEHHESGAIAPEYVCTFSSLREVKARLRLPEYRDAVFVMLITYTGAFTGVYRLLSAFDCRMLFIAWGVLPTNPAPAWRKLLARYASPVWLARTAFYMAKAAIMRHLKLVNPYEIVFAAGGAAVAAASSARRVIPINAADYDHYTMTKDDVGRLVGQRYAVFLDIYLPLQSDLRISGLKAVDAAPYFASLNRFFSVLEGALGLEIVIAAHPKADYAVTRFDGRRIYKDRTPELVRDAELVVTHTSTAMSYAVLNHKPLLFIYTDDMLRIYRDNLMREMENYARYLNASVCNADRVTDLRQITVDAVDEQRYAAYKYAFLTSPESEHARSGEIFWRAIAGDDGRRE